MKLNWFYSSIALQIVNVLADQPFACKPINIKEGINPGFSVSFYDYPFQNNELLRDLTYMEGGFKESQSLIGTVTGVTDINIAFNSQYKNYGDLYEDLYGKSVNIQNFLMYLEGYLYIDVAGTYTFNLNVDDGALVRFGGDQAFQCCNTNGVIQNEQYALWAHWDSQTDVIGETTQTYTLEVGYYPILITYVNMQIPLALDFSITLPDGTVLKDFTNIFSIPNQQYQCPA